MSSIVFHDKKWLLTGHCVLFPTRRLVRVVRGSGGVLYRDPERCSADLDGIIVGGDMADDTLRFWPKFVGVELIDELDLALELGLLGDANDHLSALRGALHQTDRPREERWWCAVAALEAWPDREGLQRGVDYLVDSTRDWPGTPHEEERSAPFDMEAPPRWVKRGGSGVEPRLAAVSLVDVDVAQVHPGMIPRILAQTRRLRCLVVRGWYTHRELFTPKLMSALMAAVADAGVEHLRFSIPLSRDAIDTLKGAPMPNLRRLTQRFAFQQHWALVSNARARHPGLVVAVDG